MIEIIKTLNLKKTYVAGSNIETHALNGVNLSIYKGDFVAIAGPSGSGKSTLLNILGALDKPSSGQLIYDNQDITLIEMDKLSGFRLKEVGFVFQAYNLINTLTAFENVEYILLLQGVDKRIRKQKVNKALEQVGLKDYINRFPNQMSGGQQQRVAVARAICSEPAVVMADEPTANLDSKTAESLIDLMKQLNNENNITFIFSTHDSMVMKKAKRLIHIKDGVLV